MVYTKICGIHTPEEIKICVSAGVHALGFICGTTHVSEDAVDIKTLKELTKKIPPFVTPVLVTHITELSHLEELIKESGLHTIQLQGDISYTDVLSLKLLFPDRKFIKAIHVNIDDAVEKAMFYKPIVDAILLDTRTEDRLGGTGIAHDWNLSKKIKETLSCPVILAGGLSPLNVETAIKIVNPYGVDANSKLKNAEGTKDRKKVKDFITTVMCYG